MFSVEIRVKGRLDPHWSEWFADFAITHIAGDETILSGVVADQAALYGLLARMRDLGLTLVSVRLSDTGDWEAGTGDQGMRNKE